MADIAEPWSGFTLWGGRLPGAVLFEGRFRKEELYSFLFCMAREPHKFGFTVANPCYAYIPEVIRTFFFHYLSDEQWREACAVNTLNGKPAGGAPSDDPADLPPDLPWAAKFNRFPLWTRLAYTPTSGDGNQPHPLTVLAPGPAAIITANSIRWHIADHGTALAYLFSAMEGQPSTSSTRVGPENHILPALAMYTQMLKLLATTNRVREGSNGFSRAVDVQCKMPRVTCVVWPRWATINAVIALPPIFGATLVAGDPGREYDDYPLGWAAAYDRRVEMEESKRVALQNAIEEKAMSHARLGLHGVPLVRNWRAYVLSTPLAPYSVAYRPQRPPYSTLPPLCPLGEYRALTQLKLYLRGFYRDQNLFGATIPIHAFPANNAFTTLLQGVQNPALRQKLQLARKSVGELLFSNTSTFHDENLLTLLRVALRSNWDNLERYQAAVHAFAVHVVDTGVLIPTTTVAPAYGLASVPLPARSNFRERIFRSLKDVLRFAWVSRWVLRHEALWWDHKFGHCAESQPFVHFAKVFQHITNVSGTAPLLEDPIPRPPPRRIPVPPPTAPASTLHILEGIALEGHAFAYSNPPRKFSYADVKGNATFMEQCANCRGLLRMYGHGHGHEAAKGEAKGYSAWITRVLTERAASRDVFLEAVERAPAIW